MLLLIIFLLTQTRCSCVNIRIGDNICCLAEVLHVLVHHRHMDILYAECPSVESLVFHCNNKCSCFRKSKGNIKKQADIVSRGKSKSTFIRKQLKLTAVFYLKFDKKPMDTYIHGYTASYASGELIFTSSFSSFASTVSIKYTETSIIGKTITSLSFFLW